VNVRHVHWTKRIYTPPLCWRWCQWSGQGVCLGGGLVGKFVIGYDGVEVQFGGGVSSIATMFYD
jgi:hypothetical protein